MGRKQLSNFDDCPNPNNISDCLKIKVKASKTCSKCYAHKRLGKSFKELYGEEKSKNSSIKKMDSMKNYLLDNPEELKKRSDRCKKNGDVYSLWIKKYGKDEADKRKLEHDSKIPKFKKGEENVNHLPHVKQLHSIKTKQHWENNDDYRKKMSEQMIGNTYCLGLIHTTETKRKQRLSAIKQFKNKYRKGFHPNYNKYACEYFNQLMIEKNINIQHAENGGEYHIQELGYWLDGYDKENNIVYEIDEKKKMPNNILLQKHIDRQIEIEEFLKCKFIRIKYTEL